MYICTEWRLHNTGVIIYNHYILQIFFNKNKDGHKSCICGIIKIKSLLNVIFVKKKPNEKKPLEELKENNPSKFSHLDVRKTLISTTTDKPRFGALISFRFECLKKYSVMDIFKIEAFQIFKIVIVLKCEPFFIKPYQLYQSLQKKSAFNKYFHTAI